MKYSEERHPEAWRRTLRLISPTILTLVFALALFPPLTRAADDPTKALQTQFEAAKASLSAGDLVSAENHYLDTITIGLRQLAQLALSLGQTDQAANYLDSALRLKPNDVETELDAAGVWFRKGEVAKAKALLKSVVEEEPQNARAHGLLGRVYVFEGDSDNAIQELKTSVDLADDFETSYFLGIAYLTAKKLPEASAWFHQLESKMGESAALHMLFGRAYLVAKMPQQAIPEFRQVIKLDPKYPRAHGFLGYAYLEHYQEEGYPQAREEFEKEVKLHPDEYQVLELLGIANVNLRDFPAAEAALLRAARLHPQESSIYLYLGETYASMNRTKAAVEVLEKYVSMESNPQDDKLRDVSRAYYLLGQNLRRLGQEEEARKALLRSQQIREAKFKYDVKHIFEEKKNPDQERGSRVSDRIADTLEVGSPEARQGAQTMVQQSLPANVLGKQTTPKEAEAVRRYRSFVAEILGSSYNDLGVMRAKDSKFLQAAEFFRQASLWKPDLAGLDRNWGLASFRAELYQQAVPPLEREVRAHPDDSFVREILGLSYSILENYPKVVDVLQPLLSHPPDDPGLLFAWGTALVQTHQSGAAAEIFRRLLERNKGNPQVDLLLGKAYAQQKDYANAINELKNALQLEPRLPEAHYYAGLVYLHQGDFQSAAREFRAELEIRPGDPHTMYHLGYTLLSQGELPEAVTLLREVVKTIPNYEVAYFELGRALLQQEDTAGAIDSLETAKKLAPDHDAVYFQLSQAYRRAGRMQEAGQALANYQKLIEANRLKKRESLEIDKP
ncbi:MAG TPA: tetratricopeptide repeat protein [Candidatus Angelobacter sp.]|nr:tetratricopeptide repeat protein [Candidatus Angelobacter sp.]